MPNSLTHRRLLPAPFLRLAILDSPVAKSDDESPVIAAMMVPKTLSLFLCKVYLSPSLKTLNDIGQHHRTITIALDHLRCCHTVTIVAPSQRVHMGFTRISTTTINNEGEVVPVERNMD